ncbi:MAG: MnhB domain-containing protein [Acidimicrobiia bacterium]|nr:MnhB domain-containing protein [Acidimicrobiia bacterium]
MNSRRPSPILEAGVVAVLGPLLLFSLYLLLAGHNQPGGGFAGGLVASVGILLAWAAGGPDGVSRAVPVRSTALMGTGLVLAVLVGLGSALPGLSFLESGFVEVSLPGIAKIKLVSALLFDVGVYLVIIGITLGLIVSLGEEGAEGTEEAK